MLAEEWVGYRVYIWGTGSWLRGTKRFSAGLLEDDGEIDCLAKSSSGSFVFMTPWGAERALRRQHRSLYDEAIRMNGREVVY